MKIRCGCLPCIVKQAYNTVRRSTSDPQLQCRVVQETMRRLSQVALKGTPAEHAMVAFEVAREFTGVEDPYRDDKRECNDRVLNVLPNLRGELEQAADPLRLALQLAVAGNIIDLGIRSSFDLERDVLQQAHRGFDHDEYEDFLKAAQEADGILYIGDNAGEIALDRLAVEVLGPERITFVVKGGPIVNDALREDAEQVGLTELCRVIDTGRGEFGFLWEHVSEQARQAFEEANLALAKGHANFETISQLGPEGDKVFYLLKAKCEEVASELGIEMGDVALISHRTMRRRATG